MKLFRLVFRRKRATVILAGMMGTLSGFASSLVLAVIHAALQPGARLAQLGTICVALCLCVLATRLGSELLLLRYALDVIFEMRTGLARQIVRTPLRQIERIGAARILTVLTEDVQTIGGALPGLLLLLPTMAVVLGCFFYMAWLSTALFAIALVGLAVGVASNMGFLRAARGSIRAARAEQDALMGYFTALTSGIKELQQHEDKAHEFLTRLLEGTAGAVRSKMAHGMSIHRVANNWGQLLFLLVIALIVFVGPRFHTADAAVLAGFTIVILYLTRPLELLLSWVPELGKANVAIERIEALGFQLAAPLATQSTPRDEPRDRRRGHRLQSLELRGVRYTYPEDAGRGFSFGPVDLELRAGEITFLAGGNGAGKTTFAKLLTGLYEPDEGEIRVDGMGIGATQRHLYRQYFSAVYSDSYLFQDLLGHRGSAAMARSLIERLQLEHKVTAEDRLFSTTALSQGQRKRLMLLVALLEDRPVYVFDEWAADQDPRFRKTFYTELLPELRSRGKAVFVITHDDRYFGLADHLLKLEDGRIVEDVRRRADATASASP